ncbi:unnamed protein product [Brassica oleracea]
MHLWSQNSSFAGDSLEFILAEKTGRGVKDNLYLQQNLFAHVKKHWLPIVFLSIHCCCFHFLLK